jgi:hypothetical protein
MDGLVADAARPTGRIAVYTTMYPGVERFLAEWYRSLKAQDDRDFDLWIGSDGLAPDRVRELLGEDPDARWIVAEAGMTPAQVRAAAIGEIVDQYDSVIFVDSDDVLLPARTAAAREALRTSDVSGCALRVIDGDGRDLGVVFGAPASTDWGELLPRYNVFGLSNSSYRCEALARCLPIPSRGVLVDWLLATRAWLLGCRLAFDEEPRMQYRQYDANVAKVLGPYSRGDVLRAALRVALHYDCLLDEPAWPIPPDRRPRWEAERSRVRGFLDAAGRAPEFLDEYLRGLNRLPAAPVWWWSVAHPDLESSWKN